MTGDDIRKLLGGYATGTLTPEERRALFAAALEDQDLFDALAREEALRDLLSDPAARGQLLAALDARPDTWWQRATHWLLRPAGVGALAGLLVAVAGYSVWRAKEAREPVLVADQRVAATPAPAAAAPTPPATPVAAPEPAATPARSAPAPRIAAAQPVATPRPEPQNAANERSADAAPLQTPAAPAAQPAPPPPPAKTELAKGAAGGGTQSAQTLESVQAQAQTQVAATGQVDALQQAELKAAPAPMPLLRPSKAAPSAGALGGVTTETVLMSKRNDAEASLRWTALRRGLDGRLAPVAVEEIRAGDSIVLRFTPPADGAITVSELRAGSAVPVVIVRGRVERAKNWDTPPLSLDLPGTRRFAVSFAPQPPAPAVKDAAARAGEVAPSATRDARPAAITITLRFQ